MTGEQSANLKSPLTSATDINLQSFTSLNCGGQSEPSARGRYHAFESECCLVTTGGYRRRNEPPTQTFTW
jgi:hypothetical protein